MKVCLMALLGLWCLSVQATSDFITIDWEKLISERGIPRYTTSVDLGNASALKSSCSVKLLYPEFEELKKTELERIDSLPEFLSDEIEFQTRYSVARKKTCLSVDFIPIIYRNKKYYKLVSFKLDVHPVTIKSASVLSQSGMQKKRYTSQSVLSKGYWVKISVDEAGVYQLTNNMLQSMGFSDPENVRLYGYGGLVQDEQIDYESSDPDYDDLEEVPLYKGKNGWLFYAEGCVKWSDWTYHAGTQTYRSTHTNNPYSRHSYYFLTEGEPMEFPKENNELTDNEISAFYDRVVYEEDAFSWYESGRKFYDSYDFIAGNSKIFKLRTPDLNTSRPAAIRVAFSAANNSSTSVQVDVNEHTSVMRFSVPAIGVYEHGREEVATFASSDLVSGENHIKITTAAGRNARLDYIAVNYFRNLNLSSNCLLFTSYNILPQYSTFVVGGADEYTRVWQIGKAGVPTKELEGILDSGMYKVTSLAENGQKYVAVDVNASFPSPSFVEVVENQNLHEEVFYDYVIIVPKSGKLLSEAQRLADAHTARSGLRVKVVRADQVYNEFSSGTPDATAYKRYLKMMYDRAECEDDMPRYLLLFGDGAWDNRMVTSAWRNYSPDDFLLCYESENSLNEVDSYVTDDYFGFLDDGEGSYIESRDRIDVGIGRFPVRTEAEAKIIVDKVINYMNNKNPGSWQNMVCFMGDDGDNNEHMTDADSVANSVERMYPDLQVKRYYWDAYERVSSATGNTYPQVSNLIKEQMEKGALVMNYCGHGAPASISHEKVLTLSDFENFSSDKVPLWVVASCEIVPFDMQMETIGETAVLNAKGAAVAFLGASRSVYSRPNRHINKLFMKYVLGNAPDGRKYSLGDAVRLAKDSLIVGNGDCQDLTYNKLKYMLMGDPALTLAVPQHEVVVEKINGKNVFDQEDVMLQAGSIIQVEGYLKNKENGSVMNDYQGSVTLTMYDAEEDIVCRNQDGANTPFTFHDRSKVLFEGRDSVRQGEFCIQVPVSREISYSGKNGLLSLYAVDSQNQRTANGRYDGFYFAAASGIPSDSLGPEMYIYLNTPDFVDGGKVNETPYFVAQLSDDDGINVSGNGVGHDLELIIDGKESTSYVLNSYYTNDFGSFKSGSVRYSIPVLSAGEHQLLFRAWDMNNNSSSRVLNFVVEPGLRPSLLDMACYPNPASSSTTIALSYNRPATQVRFNVSVYDCLGRMVWQRSISDSSAEGYYTLEWNLCDSNGARLPAGLYILQVSVASDSGGVSNTRTNKLIILGNK